MNAILKAASEALEFLFTSTESHFSEQRVLILQGAPANYLKAFENCQIDVINYDASLEPSWHAKKIRTNELADTPYDVVIQFAAKSENETKLHLAKSLKHLAKDGLYIGIAHNKMGSSRFHKHLSPIFPELESVSKSKCKVYYSNAECIPTNGAEPESSNATRDSSVFPDLEELSKTTTVGDSTYQTIPGVYGEKAIDKGSELLAEILRKEHWSGIGADIGCGFGYLTGEILKTRHKVKEMWLYDSDSRALEMSKLNLKDHFDNEEKLHLHWVDVRSSIPVARPVHWAVMNPPFHSGASQDFQLGQQFIEQASTILRPGSPLFMVANLHLPYEDTLFTHFRSVVKLEEKDGFKCFKAVK